MEAMHAEAVDPTVERELRPKKSTFILLRLIGPGLVLTVLAIGGSIAALFLMPLAIAGVLLFCGAGAALTVHAARVAYGKERYRFLADRVLATRGGLLSDQTTELDVRNITQVKLKLPWPRYPIFKVGDVMIESAGSGSSEIELRAIRNPVEVYDSLADLMRRNGFALQKTELLHEEHPDLVGVIIECIGLALFAVIALFFAGAQILGETAASGDIPVIGLAIGLPTVAFGFFRLTIHFLDMRRRTYRVFSDTVVYEEGFLTRHNAFFPAENLADAETKRTLVDQILGLYDVGVSCQGSGSEVKFRRLRRGKQMSDAIDQLAEGTRGVVAKPTIPAEPRAADSPPAPGEARPARAPRPATPVGVPASEAWTGEMKPSMFRALLPLLILCVVVFPMIPIWIVAMIQAGIRATCTRYSIRAGSVRSSYKFLTARERDFTYDKITGLVVNDGPIDRMLGTVTVQLWSIGASEPLVLLHVRRADLDLDALIRQAGIPDGEPLGVLPARFTVMTWLQARFGLLLTAAIACCTVTLLALLVDSWFLVAIPVVVLPTLPAVVYAHLRYARMRATLYEHHVDMTDGLLWRDHFYARYANVKKVTLTRYPWSTKGKVHFFVAGERRIAANKGKAAKKPNAPAAGQVIPYGFALRFAEGIDRKAALLDDLLEQPERDAVDALVAGGDVSLPEPALAGRPALGNSLVGLLILSVIAFPLLALLPLTFPLTILVVRRRAYRIEADRVVYTSGVLYRRQTSILFDRIDTIRHNQGALHKVFSNGNVTVMTAGSSAPDLVLKNLPGYLDFHKMIQEQYRARG